jgi:hypothetical protein
LWTAKEGAATGEALEKMKLDSSVPAEPIAAPTEPTPPPTTLEEIQKRVSEAGLPTEAIELPKKQALLDASQRLAEKSKFPVLPLQSDSLDNKVIQDAFGAFKESEHELAKSYLNYEALQKKEAVQGIENAVKTLSANPIEDATRGGRKAIDIARNQYKATKTGFEDFFKQFDNVATSPVKYAGEVTGILDNAIPGIEEHLNFDGINGRIDT